MIEIQDLHKHFGGFHAVDGVSLTIEQGSITGLIGPNGAGKTTLFNAIAGLHKPTNGKVLLGGEDITGLAPHQLFHKGVMRTFQIAHEFASMSCRENLMMVPSNQFGETLWNTWFGRKRIADQERALTAKADEVLEFLTISHLSDEKAGQVSGGQKKLLELARSIINEPEILNGSISLNGGEIPNGSIVWICKKVSVIHSKHVSTFMFWVFTKVCI